MPIAIAIIHGIGRQDKSYADGFISNIFSEYFKVTQRDDVYFESICWQEDIEPLEDELFQKLNHLGWPFLRSFFIGYAGDALSYQPSNQGTVGFYDIVHKTVSAGLNNLYHRAGPDAKLCLISHSLGTIVASNYIWDCTIGKTQNYCLESQALLSNMQLLYTMASPLAAWGLRFPEGGSPISLPTGSKWFNLYTKNDIISSPLKIINQQYQCMPNLEDVQMFIGNPLTCWNPMSHNAYWDSKLVAKHIAHNLTEL